jgi:hypothetical protein
MIAQCGGTAPAPDPARKGFRTHGVLAVLDDRHETAALAIEGCG